MQGDRSLGRGGLFWYSGYVQGIVSRRPGRAWLPRVRSTSFRLETQGRGTTMHTSWIRSTKVLGFFCVLTVLGTRAEANDHLLRWLGLEPTEYVVTVPTTYT